MIERLVNAACFVAMFCTGMFLTVAYLTPPGM